jgi:N-acetylglucosaminyldiphosphoundecaprenol N-acetyl-beta-D-mannosaminyltransferase
MNNCDFENILGFRLTTLEENDCIRQISAWIRSGEKGHYLVCANPHSLEVAQKDLIFKAAIREADIVTPDGVGILIASRILGGRIRERITGSGIFRELSRTLNKEAGHKYFFLGSTEETLELLKDKVLNDFPNIEIAGSYSPPFNPEFTPEENNSIVQVVNLAAPDVLWVGMTAPKQEKWVYQHRDRLNANFIAPVGAVFDFYIGTVKRSHPWFPEFGFEWLSRLMQEPMRLWDRAFISAPLFLVRVLMQRISGRIW